MSSILDKNLIFIGRGSTALWSILKSLNKPDARILLPVNICEIVYPIIKKAGMIPVFYDVNEFDGNARLSDIQNVFTGDESVLLAVHNFGIPLQIDKISTWAAEKGLFLIEDVCNSIGGTFDNKHLGTWGDAAIFSFGYAKIIEHGYGGAAFVKDKNLREKVREVANSLETYSDRHKEMDSKFQSQLREIRTKKEPPIPLTYISLYENYSNFLLYKIDPVSENDIKNRLQNLDHNIEERAKNALQYRNRIRSDKVRHIDQKEGQIYWRYNLLIDPAERHSLITRLRAQNVLVSTWYPPIIALFQTTFDRDKYAGSYSFSNKVINLFVDHRVTPSDISKTIEIINGF